MLALVFFLEAKHPSLDNNEMERPQMDHIAICFRTLPPEYKIFFKISKTSLCSCYYKAKQPSLDHINMERREMDPIRICFHRLSPGDKLCPRFQKDIWASVFLERQTPFPRSTKKKDVKRKVPPSFQWDLILQTPIRDK